MLAPVTAVMLAAAPATLLVWGGGKTPADAQKALDDWKSRSEGWLAFVKLADGFPRIVESKTVEGLNPGFHIVVLGACEDALKAQHVLDFFKQVEPAVYSKQATWADTTSCPGGQSGWEWSPEVARVKTKEHTLSGVLLFTESSPKMKVLLRYEPKGGEAKVSWLDEDGRDCDGAGPFEPRGAGLSFEQECITGRCTTEGRSSFRTTFTVKNGQVARTVKETVISKAWCD